MWDGAPTAPPLAASLVSDLTTAEPVLTPTAFVAPRREMFLLAADVPDRAELARAVLAMPGTGTLREVVTLVGGGVAELTDVLTRHTGLDAVHLVSHGAVGRVLLGRDVLDAESLNVFSADLRAWGAALNPGGDLLLYGCDVAGGTGRGFVADLARLTGADVTASTNPTGAAPGADWALEFATGSIEAAPLAAPAAWSHTLAAEFLFATNTDVAGAATTGLTAWTDSQALRLGGSNFATEPGTSGGTVTAAFDLGAFGGAAVGIDAIHLVRTRLTLGTGGTALTLLPGDLLLSTTGSAVLTGSGGALAVSGDEVFLFRPATAGDYSAGSFLIVLDDFGAISGSSRTCAVTVAEADTVVGDSLVPRGSFLFTHSGGTADDQIAVFTPTGVGPGRTAGTTAVLIDGGADLGMRAPIRALHLVGAATDVGGRTLAAGTLILAVDGTGTVGTNQLSVTANDLFTLAVSRTTLVAGAAVATADLLFQGADAGLSGGPAKFAAVSLAAPPVNATPTAAPDAYTTAEDAPLVVPAAAGLLANDADADSDPLAAALASGPAHGVVTVNPDGSFAYTPFPDYSGPDAFTYTVTDGRGATTLGIVSVTVAAANDAPVARDDRYTTNVNLVVLTVPLTVAAPGVLANDTDADGDPLTAQLLTTTSNGLLSFNPDGSFTYTAVLNFVGSDSFTYRAFDGAAWSAPATVFINVAVANQPPTATADAYATAEDVPLVVPAPGLLANDTDPNGDTLFVVLDSGPTRGTLALRPDGSFTYTPAADWSGTDSFTYHVSDGSRASATVAVTLTVTAVDDPPTLDPIPDRTTSEDSPPVTVALAGITAGGGEAQPLTVTATSSNPALVPNPTVSYTSPAATGVLRYQPVADGTGTATITVTVSDGTSPVTRTFTITVLAANDAPTATDDTAATDTGAAVAIDVLPNDADADGDALVVVAVGAAANGTATTNGTTITYTPAAGWSGTDTFTYTASDGHGGTATATVTVVVRRAAVSPVDPTPVDPTPVDPAPVDTTPIDTTPIDPTPTDPDPTDPSTTTQPTPDPAIPSTTTPAGPVATTPVAGGIVGFIPTVAVAGAGGVTPVTTATARAEADREPTVADVGRVFGASDAPAGGIGAPEAPAPRAAQPPVPDPVPAPPSAAPPVAPALPPAPPAAFTPPAAPVVTPPAVVAVPPAAVLAAIDEVRSDLRADAEARATTDTLVVSGGVAVAGYALLNTRAVYWFLSALLARPAVWRRFDPLDVVYAWERDQKAGGPGADESLQSMVG